MLYATEIQNGGGVATGFERRLRGMNHQLLCYYVLLVELRKSNQHE
jgi:hypothetical protein